MADLPDDATALGLKWFHSNVDGHREPGRRFIVHGVPTWFFFYRGKRLGWHGLGQFQATVTAAREKIRAGQAGKMADATSGAQVDGTTSGKSSSD